MSDLVERLRDTNRPDAMLMSYQLRREAADEIDRLRMQVNADRIRCHNEYAGRFAEAKAEIDRLRETLKWAQTCVPFPSDCHSAIANTLKEIGGGDD